MIHRLQMNFLSPPYQRDDVTAPQPSAVPGNAAASVQQIYERLTQSLHLRNVAREAVDGLRLVFTHDATVKNCHHLNHGLKCTCEKELN